MSDTSRLGSQFSSNVAAQACSRALSMVTTLVFFVLVARLAGPDTLGRVSYVVAFLSITAAFADLGTGTVLARDFTAASSRCDVYLGNFILVRLLLAAVAIAGGFAITFVVPADLWWPIRAFLVAAPLLGVRLFDTVFQVFGKPWYSAAVALAKTTLTLPAIFAVLSRGAGLIGCMTVFVGAELCCFAAACMLTRTLVRPRLRLHRPTIMAIGRTAIPIGISAVFMLLNNRIDVFMLAAFRGPEELGIYTTAYRFLDLGTTAIMTLTVPLLPILSEQARRNPVLAQATYRALIATLVGFALPLAAITPFVSPYLIGLLYGPGYAPAALILNILVWAFVATLYDSVTFAFLLSIDEIRYAQWNSIAAAAINVGLNAWLIPELGMAGAAWATLGSFVSLAVGQSLILHRARLKVVDRRLLALCLLNGALVLILAGLRWVGAEVAVAGLVLVTPLVAMRYGLIPWTALRRSIVNARE